MRHNRITRPFHRHCTPRTPAASPGAEPLEILTSPAAIALTRLPEFHTIPIAYRDLVLRTIDPAFASLTDFQRRWLLHRIAQDHGFHEGGVMVDGEPFEISSEVFVSAALKRLRDRLPGFGNYLEEAIRLSGLLGGARKAMDFEEYMEALYHVARNASFSHVNPLTDALAPPQIM